MKVGIYTSPTTSGLPIGMLAKRCEDLGFESLMVPEHTHIPASRDTPYVSGGELPDVYTRLFDPFVALTAAACATSRITLGTSISLILQHDPIALAKTVATLDVISKGRLLLGVGVGWNIEEMVNHGVDPLHRGTHLDESIEALRTIWRDDEASYSGRVINFDRIWSWPKPHDGRQVGFLIGGNSRAAMTRAVRTASGWLPYLDRTEGWLQGALLELERLAAEEDAPTPLVTLFMAGSKPSELAEYRELGVDRCLLWVPEGTLEEVEERLERYASSVAALEH